MVLLGLLAAMMLVAAPVLAWQPGPNEGNKYSKNYYPNSYFKYCEPDGSQYYGKKKASNEKVCFHRYIKTAVDQPAYKEKWINGKQYYYVHVYYFWKTPDGQSHYWKNHWYYCQHHKYDDPGFPKPYFKAWVTYEPTGNHYWERFYYMQYEG
jgi:hypothetical protein